MACQRASRGYDLLVGWQPGAAEPFELAVIDHTFLLHEGWSPDGTVLTLIGHSEPGEWILYEAHFPAGEIRVIEHDADRFSSSPTAPVMWSSDSSAYYFRFRDDRLAVRLIHSGETVVVDGGDGTSASAIGWSLVP